MQWGMGFVGYLLYNGLPCQSRWCCGTLHDGSLSIGSSIIVYIRDRFYKVPSQTRGYIVSHAAWIPCMHGSGFTHLHNPIPGRPKTTISLRIRGWGPLVYMVYCFSPFLLLEDIWRSTFYCSWHLLLNILSFSFSGSISWILGYFYLPFLGYLTLCTSMVACSEENNCIPHFPITPNLSPSSCNPE